MIGQCVVVDDQRALDEKHQSSCKARPLEWARGHGEVIKRQKLRRLVEVTLVGGIEKGGKRGLRGAAGAGALLQQPPIESTTTTEGRPCRLNSSGGDGLHSGVFAQRAAT